MSLNPKISIALILLLSAAGSWLTWQQGDATQSAPGAVIHSLPSAQLLDYDFSREASARLKLPKRLSEISGVAVTADDRLLVHGDEEAIVYELDPADGNLVTLFQLQQPVLRGDFEGIEVIGDTVYLITSLGVLYTVPNGRNYREAVLSNAEPSKPAFELRDLGLAADCEVEGLSAGPDGRLLIACKEYLAAPDQLMIYAFEPATASLDQWLSLPMAAVSELLNKRRFSPSGIVWRQGAVILAAGRQHAMLEVDADGLILAAVQLSKAHHRQAEGIGFLSDGTLVLADEGAGKKGQVGFYRLNDIDR